MIKREDDEYCEPFIKLGELGVCLQFRTILHTQKSSL